MGSRDKSKVKQDNCIPGSKEKSKVKQDNCIPGSNEKNKAKHQEGVEYAYPSSKEKFKAKQQEIIEHAYRIPIFLSTTTHLNDKQNMFLNRLILEIENALLFPRTLPLSESYPEIILTDIRRVVSSSYGMLAMNFRRFFVEVLETNEGPSPSTAPSWQGSVYSQVEPSMAFQFGLPLLLVREDNTDANNGIWSGGIVPLNTFIVWDSENQTVDEFFSTIEWREAFANWSAEVRNAYYIQTEPKFKYRCDR
ncbi:hypothetical protein [Bacillus sp. MUM 116]|uniref:hypothetical protein n=1 Tax=Bacillus sp. MUM 116 TaxID=1678002 RepID=UPI000B1E3DCE|nr:hypothetical protein [Bacillus sp. MUM 116]